MMSPVNQRTIFLYGPPGTGKSTIGESLANELELTFVDLDDVIESKSGEAIPEIFTSEGESGFRKRERMMLQEQIKKGAGVIALGGGALLDTDNRKLAEDCGEVICFHASEETILNRLSKDPNMRPLLSGDPGRNLRSLLANRREHYLSFPLRLDSSIDSIEILVWEIQHLLGRYRVKGMGGGYDVFVRNASIDQLGSELRIQKLLGPVALVSDDNVAPFYAHKAVAALEKAGYSVHTLVHPAGEENKTIQKVETLWEGFLTAGLDRSSTVVALGGGVVGDLAGFAAATYKRGIKWVVVPTSLLAMCDASLGGKTGADLSHGKNLVGAFHTPSLVLVDPSTLKTLPQIELRNGMAEIIKHGIIADPVLFDACKQGWDYIQQSWMDIIVRAMAVKIRIIQKDPFEKGERAVLNLGHTLGHAIETASNYSIKHGEAVSIGMVSAARLSEKIGIAEAGLKANIKSVLESIDLPTELPENIDPTELINVMSQDKKRKGGVTHAVLPVRIGEVRWGVKIDSKELIEYGGRL